MSYRFEKERTKTTPYILIDEEEGYMRFEGESYLEDISSFFEETRIWLEKYLLSDFKLFKFDCAMIYFNSSTVKLLYNFLRLMDKHSVGGNNVIVNWIVSNNDEMIIDCGEDFKEEMENLEFNIVINPV